MDKDEVMVRIVALICSCLLFQGSGNSHLGRIKDTADDLAEYLVDEVIE